MINPLALNYEKTLWKLHHISNLVLEVQLAYKEDLKKPTTFFQRLANACNLWAKAQPTWKELHKVLATITPTHGSKYTFTNVRKTDSQLFQEEPVTLYHPQVNVALPKFRHLPEYYR